mgnify:CR=1 FL=1
MDGMYGAIKNRRGGLLNDKEENAQQMMDQGGGKHGEMKSLLSQLSDEQKSELMGLLEADMDRSEGMDPKMIEKGAMGPGEREDLAESVEAGELGGDHETEEDIMNSMVSTSDEMRDKPRNLGDRVRMEMSKKLKMKKGE